MKFMEIKKLLLGVVVTVVEDVYDKNNVLIGSNVPVRNTILDSDMLDPYLNYDVTSIVASNDCIIVNVYRKSSCISVKPTNDELNELYYCGICGYPVSQEEFIENNGLCHNCYEDCCTEGYWY